MLHKSKGSILFIASPNIGILDNILPVVAECKKELPEYNLILIIPKSVHILRVDTNSTVNNIANDLFDTVLYKSIDRQWKLAPDLYKARKAEKDRFVSRKVIKLFKKLQTKISSNFFKKVEALFFKILFKEKNIMLKLVQNKAKAIVYDIYTEEMEFTKEVLKPLDNIPRFSFSHGINLHTFEYGKVYPKTPALVKSYLFSMSESDYYKNKYQLSDSQLSVVGVLRHNKEWIDFLTNQVKKDELPKGDYILLVSRPVEPNMMPYFKKKKMLEDIKKVFTEIHPMKIVIKKHPKEGSESIYEDILGKNNYGTTWEYSSLHPIILSKHCKFGITFFSGVCVDLINAGAPVLEYLDLEGLDKTKLPISVTTDEQGETVLSYRAQKLVYGASNYDKLLELTNDILNDKVRALETLSKVYKEHFQVIDNPAKEVTKDIKKSLID